MRKLYGTFLIRCWRMDAEERFEIQHIQSGESVVVPALADIADWIRTHAGSTPTTPVAPPPSRLVDGGNKPREPP